MHALPFQHIRRIERILDHARLEDLVLILSQADGTQYLLVYNAAPPVRPADAAWETCRLGDLIDDPTLYTSFDGPVVGFAALELLLPDLPSYGVNFYTIDRLFHQHRQLNILHRSGYQLAQTLISALRRRAPNERESVWMRGCARAIELALPHLLAGQSLDNLVAIVLESDDSADFLDLNSCRLLYNSPGGPNDLLHLPQQISDSGQCWVAALDEIYLFHPQLPRPATTDLRVILRRMDLRRTQQQTCRALAMRCWGEWNTSSRPEFRDAAYSLAAESWLAEEDVEDLVALAPHCEFERFAREGNALRVYRVPAPAIALTQRPPGLQCAVEDLVHWPGDDLSYATVPISLGVLTPVLQKLRLNERQDVIDLGTILWKADRMAEVARTFWLLSRDLLDRPATRTSPGSVWTVLAPEPSAITDLAIRAALIYSLGDPWRWRQGRYEIFLRDCYAHVLDCLRQQVKHFESSPLAHYYQALIDWYGYATADDPVRSLNEMLRSCRTLQENCPSERIPGNECAAADRLIEIGERLLFPEREGDNHFREQAAEAAQPFPVITYLRTIIDSKQPLSVPSDLFDVPFRAYCAAHDRWLRIQRSLHASRPLLGELNNLLAEYRRLQRIIHVPHHEFAILNRAYSDDIERIDRLRRAGGSEPLIRITLRNPWVTLNAKERLIFRVENLGGSHAEQLELTLYRSNSFDLFSSSDPLVIGTLAPGAGRRAEYEIRARDPELAMRILWSYRDQAGQLYSYQETIRPETRELTIVRGKPGGNPYEVGRPVSGAARFFGRRDELEQILTRLSKGSTQPILLRGPRRIGKTSLLKRVDEVLRNRMLRQQLNLAADLEIRLGTIFPVSVSLQSIDPTVESYNAYFLQMIVGEICKVLGLGPDPALKTDLARWRLPAHTFLEQVNWILSQRPGARLLILIDEWDEISNDKFRDLGRNLRHIVQEEQRISWAFSSTWALTAEVGRFGSPWFNILDRIELKAMDWESATQLVTVPSETVEVDWAGEAVVAVLEQTGRRPYLMQLLCSRIIDNLIRRSSRVVEPQTVEIVINIIIADTQVTEQYLGFLWGDARGMGHLIIWALERSLPTPLSEQEIRRAIIVEHRNRIGLPLSREQFNREFDEEMTWLRHVADAVTLEEDHYTFSFPLVQRWLHHVIRQREEQISRAFERLAVEAAANAPQNTA